MKIFLIALLAACTSEVPDAPSFQLDVLPILGANCVRCHGSPALGGAPRDLRLDSYSDVDDVGVPTAGAASYAMIIDLRLVDPRRPMPPRFPLDDYQRETLQRWARAPERGAPRAGNRPPIVSVEATPIAGGAALRVRVSDPDGDLVAGSIRTAAGTVVGAVRSGAIDLALVAAPGTHPLVAHVDDGAEVHAIALGAVEVP